MNPLLDQLHRYPFERLRELVKDVRPPEHLPHIPLSLGEPRHAPPDFVIEGLTDPAALKQALGQYPPTRGSDQLRTAIAEWLERRFRLTAGALDPQRHVLPVNGTREALFAVAQALIDGRSKPLVMLPNPFYQIYEGAALLAGGQPRYLPCTAATGFLPDLDAVGDKEWSRCQLIYLCSPGNPSGAIMPPAQLQRLLRLADRFDFVIVADECYSELYPSDAPPPAGLLSACHASGNSDFERCLVFNSLSKRSNLPGLRSGLVAGDPRLIERFLLYRTYHGSAMPPATQLASTLAWRDEQHVQDNRAAYDAKFASAVRILSPLLEIQRPAGGFYLWPQIAGDDRRFAKTLFEQQHVSVLPGSLLGREIDGDNPGHGRIRLALVAAADTCNTALERIARHLQHQQESD